MRCFAPIVGLLVFVAACFGANLTFYWQPPVGGASAYQLTIGTNPSVYLTATNYTQTNAACGFTNSASVRAVGPEGLLSDPASITYFLPCPASNMRNVNAMLESAPDVNGPWHTETNFPTVAILVDNNRRFYRLKANIQ